MEQQEFCKECGQSKSCREIYRQLGGTNGPSVVIHVIIAFLLPLLVFIGFLAVFGQIFDNTPVSFLLAVSATFGVILVTKAVSGRSFEKR